MTRRPVPDGGGSDDQPNQPPQLTYDIDDEERPSEAIVKAVAAFTNSSLVELQPLYDVIDPVTLDGMFERTMDSPVETQLTFAYSDCEVRVTANVVHVIDPDDRE